MTAKPNCILQQRRTCAPISAEPLEPRRLLSGTPHLDPHVRHEMRRPDDQAAPVVVQGPVDPGPSVPAVSGTIEAVSVPPFFALAGQLDLQAKYMLELNWAPLVGACVVRKKSWDRVPAGKREARAEHFH